jgi:hypothetical protein
MTVDAATGPEGRIFDLGVVSSGAAGLTAALTAARRTQSRKARANIWPR